MKIRFHVTAVFTYSNLNTAIDQYCAYYPNYFIISISLSSSTPIFGKPRDQIRKCLNTQRVNYVFHK